MSKRNVSPHNQRCPWQKEEAISKQCMRVLTEEVVIGEVAPEKRFAFGVHLSGVHLFIAYLFSVHLCWMYASVPYGIAIAISL
jgi:hypothetical protein